MRAAILDKYGAIEDLRIGEIERPKLTDSTILVRVCAASINPADIKVIRGKDGGGFLHARNFPTAIGFDFSGVVEQVGANAEGRAVGDEVFGHLAYSPSTKQGSFAELVAVKPDSVGIKPPGVRHEDAAAAATVGCTALQGLRDRGRLRSGQRVLVNGASGGVGSYAVQIAAALGADVVGTASAAKASFVHSLGVEEVIDYRESPLSSLNETFDVVLDAAAMSSFGEAKRLLNRGGAYVTLLPSASLFGAMFSSLFSSKRCGFVTVQSRAADLEQLASWIVSGVLKTSVEETFPLSDIHTALSALDSGRVRGKLAVRIDE
ncbi:MAG: NAD(P)-dependent alcohol dehydrogenase [Polyangiales bacterium]